ncbi:putative NADH dehydrogenase [ubiquinone] 1 alpha subcomplex subunit 5 [Chlorella vulgaris]
MAPLRAPLLRVLAPLMPCLRLEACAVAALGGVRGAKSTTGIVGLPVVEDAREELKRQLQAVLDAVAIIPEAAEYRKSIEKTVRYKLSAAAGEAPDEQLEELLGRQLEEEIKMCKEELGLIPKMAEWAPWDVPEGHTIEFKEEQQVEGAIASGGAGQAPAPNKDTIMANALHDGAACFGHSTSTGSSSSLPHSCDERSSPCDQRAPPAQGLLDLAPLGPTPEQQPPLGAPSSSPPPSTHVSGMDAAANRHQPALLLFWSLASGTAAYVALEQRRVPPDLVLLLDSTFWLAAIACISFTEAWVKFRAPLLDRWRGVDVGRRVFRAQYAMESAMALTAAITLWIKANGNVQGALSLVLDPSGPGLLAAAAAVLVIEQAWVFPALDLRGAEMIATAASAQLEALTPEQQAYVAELQRVVAHRARPPPQLHYLSILLAFSRASMLAAFVWSQMLVLA